MRRFFTVCLLVAAACSEPAEDPADAGLLRPDAALPPPTTTTLVVTITDGESGPPIPGRVVLFRQDGTHLGIGKLDMWDGIDQGTAFCDVGPGVLGTWDGIVLPDGTGEIPVGDDHCDPSPAVPFGTYRLLAFQGIEHEMFETQVVLQPRMGKVLLRAPLARAWTPDGALAADLHVHALGSGDSLLPRDVRVHTELTAGIQVIGASDHNFNSDYGEVIEALGLRGKIASIPGNEASTNLIHANVFPVFVDPSSPTRGAPPGVDIASLSAAEVWARLRALPGNPLIQLNHPRLRYAAYYDYVGWNGVSWPPPMPIDFDAVEVLNGMSAFNPPEDRRIERSAEDLYTLLEHGVLVAGVANTDTHHLTSILAGVPRNYVFVNDPRLDPFDESGFIDSLRKRRVLMTTGPWLDVRAGGARSGDLGAVTAGKVRVEILLLQASYVKATRVQIWVRRNLVETLAIPDGATRFEWSGEVTVGAGDSWIGVDALGTAPVPAVLHGLASKKAPMPPFAMINPILVDGNADGQYTPPSRKPWIAPDVPAPPWDPSAAIECEPPWLAR